MKRGELDNSFHSF